MPTSAVAGAVQPGWKERSKDQWIAHVAAWLGALLVYPASSHRIGVASLIGTVGGLISFIVAMPCGPETRRKILVANRVVT